MLKEAHAKYMGFSFFRKNYKDYYRKEIGF